MLAAARVPDGKAAAPNIGGRCLLIMPYTLINLSNKISLLQGAMSVCNPIQLSRDFLDGSLYRLVSNHLKFEHH